MGLLSLFRRKQRDKSPELPTNEEMEVQFQKWFHNVTIVDIRSLFLDNLLGGHELKAGLLREDELEHFDAVVRGLESAANNPISILSILDFLKQAHRDKVQFIEAAGPILENLIISHAHFPFSEPVSLTRDTLLQAIILLTYSCNWYFTQSSAICGVDTIRKRPKRRRLLFIYSALIRPPIGLPTRHDVTDIVCRLNYPLGFWAKPKGEPLRKIVREIEPLAERLQPEEDVAIPEPMPASALQPLADLVAVFPSRFQETVADVGFGNESLTARQFVDWAKRVRLFDVLNEVFEVFLHERK